MVEERRHSFPRHHRIVRGSDYRAIYDTGRKLRSESFVLFRRENELGHHRLGITVSRKVGSAVVRNRIKRLFREIFRTTSAEIPGHFDFIINARRSCGARKFAALREEFLSVVRRGVA